MSFYGKKTVKKAREDWDKKHGQNSFNRLTADEQRIVIQGRLRREAEDNLKQKEERGRRILSQGPDLDPYTQPGEHHTLIADATTGRTLALIYDSGEAAMFCQAPQMEYLLRRTSDLLLELRNEKLATHGQAAEMLSLEVIINACLAKI